MRLGPIPLIVRTELYDLCGGVCEYCGSSDLEYNPHHKPFRSQLGAANDLDHLIWFCKKCHRMAHHQHSDVPHSEYEEFRKYYDKLDIKELRA